MFSCLKPLLTAQTTDMLSLFNEVIPDTDSPSSFPSAVILMYSLVYKIVEKYDLGFLNA